MLQKWRTLLILPSINKRLLRRSLDQWKLNTMKMLHLLLASRAKTAPIKITLQIKLILFLLLPRLINFTAALKLYIRSAIIFALTGIKLPRFALIAKKTAAAHMSGTTALRTMAHLTTRPGPLLSRMEFQGQAPVLMKEIQLMHPILHHLWVYLIKILRRRLNKKLTI